MKTTLTLYILSGMLLLSVSHSIAADVSLSALAKKEIQRSLSQEMKDVFSTMRSAENIQKVEKLLNDRLFPLLKNDTITIKGQVTTESGDPVSNAEILISEIRNPASEELHREYIPRKFRVKTNEEGYYVINNLPIYDFYKLGIFMINNISPKPNFKLSVSSGKYQPVEKEFLSVNRQVLALTMEMLDILYYFADKEGKNIPTVNKDYKIPFENTLDTITMDVILKK
ncbi:carboxypeptidase-like regulatory domain-containing protein [Akkermansia muciniphila]|uniref:carboxypeptidase-like regulatory domain-containing protein n=1 Tax=Akkermansia muciniphila TaxID=239935 RepID=UPI001BFFC9D7|nr:carboxypeptidase-like regulatory domain-containing protein [Akkermansia muciniphila]MBT8778150.1 carboxypeptidase regulatory-like domain-containing protein [Akkermansia muciniphila]